ncbi:MAG: Hsp20/alpha crystallin family protein [Syntrophaceae bacterium]
MSIRDLTTRVRDEFFPRTADPVQSFQREMNRLFQDFFEVAPFGGRDSGIYPEIDVKETDKEIKVSAEVPGLEEKDVEVLLSSDSLTIKGEKKQEKEERGQSYYRSERRYGSFSRVIPLASDIEADKAEARFKNGVLYITIPKTEKAKADVKKIPIKT